MDNKNIQKIIDLNAHFYEAYAKEFSVTRQAPWPGWSKLKFKDILQDKMPKILDLGCGNGRFYKFAHDIFGRGFDYEGVDISKSLIKEAKSLYPQAGFEATNFLSKIEKFENEFDAVVGFGVMHHIPTYQLRTEFLKNVADYLNTGGVAILTFWTQVPDQEKRKNENQLDLEQNDYLVEWDNNKEMFRYVHVFDNDEINKIKNDTKEFGLELINEFKSDGKNGDSNVYLVWRKHA
jgi:tRNA (uracil-5-)-methyltransferase TRM9